MGCSAAARAVSRAKWGWLPEAHTDFILAVIGEEFGLVGSVTVIVAFAMFMYAGCRIGLRRPDIFGRLVAFGVTTWIGVQALINIGVTVGTLPTKGITLAVRVLRRLVPDDVPDRRRRPPGRRPGPVSRAQMTDPVDAARTGSAEAPAATWLVIAGGGTAGHLLPGLAVARELVRRGHDPATIHFVGAERGTESTIVPEAGFAITLLPGRGIQRSLDARQHRGPLGSGASRRPVRSDWSVVGDPDAVLALGGFASVACAMAAVLWRVPLVIAEQNAKAGAANRLTARFAAACAVPFDDTDLPSAVGHRQSRA